jgi:hypothetical protein
MCVTGSLHDIKLAKLYSASPRFKARPASVGSKHG